MSNQSTGNRGMVVALAGMGVNLCLGVLYSWGAFQGVLVVEPLNWTSTQSQIPYMIACFIFAVSMVPGGRLQDRIGPRTVIIAAGVLALIGMVLSGFLITPVGLSISFGIVFGLAMGFGYAAPTPAAVKWFGPHKRGLISGIVVSGFGLAGVYVAPLSRYLLAQFGLANTFIILGIAYGIIIILLAQLISNPPAGYIPEPPPEHLASKFAAKAKGLVVDWDYKQMMKTPQFYGLWGMFCIGTFAGLLIIGQLRRIGIEQAALNDGLAFWLISMYAVFNWGGRIGCGIIADKLGFRNTLVAMFILQVAVFALFSTFVTAVPLFIATALVAFAFGGMLTIFPAITANYFGVKNLGVNYGLVFTAWGGGGVFGPLVGGLVRDATGTFGVAYTISAVLSVLGIILAVTMKAPKDIQEEEQLTASS
ncbi:L-lactate MFS transporter [Candidatus Contubernalis alkaliaceticus]|uniref:L-lactate MFS transporter n=1 Tax=Candidatus Contubernalis alkaliaceticus TaxID=338645 RepID=UPI001F4C4986|nr:OFA family MFS transporter [Candidatus Contubernalis alkalaceticus]UNC90779.1 OFA family MFS transporter [Candidatus Contubernalis alkalaceticus]